MNGTKARQRVTALLATVGYEHFNTDADGDDSFRAATGHVATWTMLPSWGGKVDALQISSRYPLTHHQGLGLAFTLDVGSQPGVGAGVRWKIDRIVELTETHLGPYLAASTTPADLVWLVLDRSVAPIGGHDDVATVRHCFHLVKWWQLSSELGALRSFAQRLSDGQRRQLTEAPWGRTELSEVLWHDRSLPTPPDRAPWGLADQGDQRADAWFEGATDAQAARQEWAAHVASLSAEPAPGLSSSPRLA